MQTETDAKRLRRDFVPLQPKNKWGSVFFNQLSLDLRTEFPNATGFSVTNLKYIRRWYAFYNDGTAIRHQAGDEIVLHQQGGCRRMEPQ